MVPHIFISSTINDLHHLRDSIRATILDLSYKAVMSEYGDFGYLPNISVEASCYQALKDCQLAIIIVSKIYGNKSENGLSITHNEFNTAKNRNIPVIFLVSDEILHSKSIFDANQTVVNFPGMDDPKMTFRFLDEFKNYKVNNGFLKFSSVSDAKEAIKKQLAYIFGDLIRRELDPIRNEIKDILSEITTLRHSLIKTQDEGRKFLYVYRYLLEDESILMSRLIKKVSGSLEEGVPVVMKSQNLEEYLKLEDYKLVIDDSQVKLQVKEINKDDFDWMGQGVVSLTHHELPFAKVRRQKINSIPFSDIEPTNKEDSFATLIVETKKILVNRNANQYLNAILEKLKSKAV